MLLITFNRDGAFALATQMSLPDALLALRKYQNEHNSLFPEQHPINFRLIGVSPIDAIDKATLRSLNVLLVEDLIASWEDVKQEPADAR